MKKALQFLQKHVDVAFATCSDNLPKLRVFRIMKQDDSVLYFATSAQKVVYRELKQNPHVELLASEGDISVCCSGTVSFDVDEATKRWIYEHNDVLSQLYDSYDKMEYFCMPIAEMDYYDLAPTPPLIQHFDLRK